MSLTVVFSSKKVNQDFIELVKATSGVHKIEILPYENPGKYSLSEVVKAHQDLEGRKILGPAVIIP